MKRVTRKLSGKSGETLAETLCALLVIVLSSVLLAGMLSAAAHLNAQAMAQDQKLAGERAVAETQTLPDDSAGDSVSVTAEGALPGATLPVTYYRQEGGALTSYAYRGGTGGGGA